MSDLFQKLDRFVDLEYETQVIQTKAIWQKPLDERVAEGEALDQISILSNDGHTLRIRSPINDSKFREGSSLRLHRTRPEEGLSCEVLEDAGHEMTLTAGYNTHFNDVEGSGWVLDNDLIDIRHILQTAVQEGANDAEFSAYFKGMISGNQPTLFDQSKAHDAMRAVEGLPFNRKQAEAFVLAYASKNYYMIQGPPGTGKTWVLARLAETLAQQGERVLITAFTHRAINNALEKVARTTGYDKVFKIGQPARTEGLSWASGEVPNFKYFSDAPYAAEEQGFIVGGTCFAVRGRRLQEVNFDTILFDEASQITLPLAIAGMLAGKRHIFIGDHKQLPPVIVAEHEEQHVTRSIFASLFDSSPGTMLDITYRMNKAINAFPSRQFYDGNLHSDQTCALARLDIVLDDVPNYLHGILAPNNPDVFVDVGNQKTGIRSKIEAKTIRHVVAGLIKGGVPASEIAIVAPYRAQGRLIREALRSLPNGKDILDDLVVDTVERMQGQERDVVIISLTTSDPSHAAIQAEFFFQPNRLNVALTRARKKRIVLGSTHVLSARAKDKNLDQWVKVLQHFFSSCSTKVRLHSREAATA